MKFYLAAPYVLRDELREVVKPQLESLGHEVTSRWLYETDSIAAKIEQGIGETDACLQVAGIDLEDVDKADAVILWTYPRNHTAPPGGGRYVEYGYAIAKGKKLYRIGVPERENVFLSLSIWIGCCWDDAMFYLRTGVRPGYPIAPFSGSDNKVNSDSHVQ